MDQRIINHAKILVDYSVNVKKGETILITGSVLAEPLIKECYRQILLKEAFPRLKVTFEDMDYLFFQNAKKIHLKTLHKIDRYTMNNIDGIISIISHFNTKGLSSIDSKKMMIHRKTQKPIKDIIINKKKWCITIHPTSAVAQDSDLSLVEFQDYVYKTLFADKKNPVSEWKKLDTRQKKITNLLTKTNMVKITGDGTDISFSVKDRTGINSSGENNMPSGEVFTSPVKTSVDGYITFTYPACFSGKEIDKVYLRFEKGKIVESSAEKNADFLKSIIDTDNGSKYLGEFGIGFNYAIDKFTKNILLDEKIGGTIHLAIGAAFPESGGKNKSAVHLDIIKDMQKNSKIFFDDKLVFSNGKWKL